MFSLCTGDVRKLFNTFYNYSFVYSGNLIWEWVGFRAEEEEDEKEEEGGG
jgi:hypothetical protein